MKNSKNIQFCKECLYGSSHPLGLTFNKDGVCSGCLVHKEKYEIDWNNKWFKLKKITDHYKSKKNNYDCIVPVTGANDSYYTVFLVKKLGLNPLLVTNNKYFNTNLGIENLANLRIKFGVDVMSRNINPETVKKITRFTLSKYGNIYWPVLAGSTVYPVQIAVKYKIPLIIWGAHQGLEQVGMYSHHNEVEMTRRYRKNHDLFGLEAEDLLQTQNLLREEDLANYIYPSDHEINQIGVKGIYLGNYVLWDQKSQHEKMIKLFNYKTSRFSRTIDCYDHVDCFNYMNLHDLLKYYKHGYSKITDQLTREIRFKRISKGSALSLAKSYEKKSIKYLGLFCKWASINSKSLIHLINSFRNKNFWKRIDCDKWEFNGWSKQNSSNNNHKKIISFIKNSDFNNQYITVGKGYKL